MTREDIELATPTRLALPIYNAMPGIAPRHSLTGQRIIQTIANFVPSGLKTARLISDEGG